MPFLGYPQTTLTRLSSIEPLGPYTVDTLPTPNAGNLGRVATVSDLFGVRYSRCRCEMQGGLYFWQPLSSDSSGNMATGANTSVFPLKNPQSLVLTGTIALGVTREFTLETTGGWPGCVKEFRGGLTSLLGTLNVLGTGLGSAVNLTLGGYRKFVLDVNAGALEWRQLV